MSKLRRYKPHTLSNLRETLNPRCVRDYGHSETFAQLTNVDMRFGTIKEEGNDVDLSQSTYLSFLNKVDRDLRRRAFHQFIKSLTITNTASPSAPGPRCGQTFLRENPELPVRTRSIAFGDNIGCGLRQSDRDCSKIFPSSVITTCAREVLQLHEIHQYDTFVPLVQRFKPMSVSMKQSKSSLRRCILSAPNTLRPSEMDFAPAGSTVTRLRGREAGHSPLPVTATLRLS